MPCKRIICPLDGVCPSGRRAEEGVEKAAVEDGLGPEKRIKKKSKGRTASSMPGGTLTAVLPPVVREVLDGGAAELMAPCLS